MKKVLKFFSVILVVAMMSVILTSCTTDELSFLTAMQKFSQFKSYQSTSEISGSITANIPEHNNEIAGFINLKSILNSFKNFKLTFDTTNTQSKDSVKSKIDMGVTSEDFMFNTSAYIKMEDGNLLETLKIPTTFRWLLPEDKMNAEYITIDMNELSGFMSENLPMSLSAFNFNTQNILADSSKFSEAYYNFQLEYAKKMTDSPKVITKTGSTYKVTFTDASLKLFVKSIVDTYLKDADARKDVEALVSEIISLYDSIYPDLITVDMKAQIFGTLGAVSATAEEYQLQVDEFFKMLENIPVLGEKGLTVTYTTDYRGFITKIDTVTNLYIDVNAINKAVTGGYADDEPFNFDILINCTTEYKNINQTVKVDFPTLTEQNNISYAGILKDMVSGNHYEYEPERYQRPELQLPAADGSISVVRYGELIDFGDEKPEIINGSLYVPFDNLAEAFYMDYRWDDASGCVIFSKYSEGDLYLGYNSDVIYADDYSIIMTVNTLEHNGKLYVPFRSFVKSVLGYNIEWSEEQNAAIIGW